MHNGANAHAKYNLHAYANTVYVNVGVLIVVEKGEMKALEQHARVNLCLIACACVCARY